jgi:hypothetical protein
VLQLKQRCKDLCHKARHVHVTVTECVEGWGAWTLLHNCFCTLCPFKSIVILSVSVCGSWQLVITIL